jgi:hypothetical protein
MDAVMMQFPALSPVITPAATDATSLFEEVQVTVEPAGVT